MARKRQTVLQLATAKLGVHKGALAAAHIAQWVIATDELGHVPSGREYADYWYVTDRTAWFHAAEARSVLGDDWRGEVVKLAARVHELSSSRSPRKLAELVVA